MKSLEYIEIDVDDFADTSSPIDQVTFCFTRPSDYLPSSIDAIPSIREINFTPARISLGKDLGERASLSISFKDHRHIFNGEDFNSGSFWGKWRARYGQRLRGRSLRWIQGLLGQTLGEMETRHFVVDSVNGPSLGGVYTIVAKDILKFLDGDRAQAPTLSTGFLVSDITASDTSATLAPSGIGDAEYPSSGYVAIGGEEICEFTRTGDVLDFSLGSSPASPDGRGQLGTIATAHEASDRVQVVLRYVGQDPANILDDLFTTYGGVPSSYVPINDWLAETENFLQRLYTATIAEPTSIRLLASELIEQAALAVWSDLENQQIRLQVLRTIATNAATFTPRNTLKDTLKIQEQPGKRISQVWTYYAQRNPLEPVDEPDNFRSTVVTTDLNAEADYGSPAIKKIFSRWIPFGGQVVASRLNLLQLSRFVDPPRKFNLSSWRRGEIDVQLGGGYNLQGYPLQTVTGSAASVPIQITSLNPLPDKYDTEAQEMLFQNQALDLTNRVIVIDAGITNINLRSLHDNIYPAPTGAESPAISVSFIINQNVIVGSTLASSPAIDVGSWPVGVVPLLTVNGRIQGKGGDGGKGGDAEPGFQEVGAPGEDGGTGLFVRSNITVNGTGVVNGGGGGGGGGSGQRFNGFSHSGGGGGGGAGQVAGEGGLAGTIEGSGAAADNGEPGTLDAGGIGGDGKGGADADGGNGGAPGVAGGDGDAARSGPGGTGGDAGNSIDGVSFITFASPASLTFAGSQIN